MAVDSHSCPIHVKVDPFRQGTCMFIYMGKTGNNLCPVGAVTAYLAVRGRAPGPFFQFASYPGSCWSELGSEGSSTRTILPICFISRELLVRHVRAALSHLQVDVNRPQFSDWGSHNCCSGGFGGLLDQNTWSLAHTS